MKTSVQCSFVIRPHVTLLRMKNVPAKKLIACLAVD